jgi:hypothetical protein
MILITHHTGEPHGLLGPQAAATYLSENLSIPSLVMGLKRDFSKEILFSFLDDYYRKEERIIGFTHLCGRKDLLELIPLVRERGFRVVSGGPQAKKDFNGEPDPEFFPTRFKGLRFHLDLAFQGPIERLTDGHLRRGSGCLAFQWDRKTTIRADWTNLYTFSDSIERLEIKTAQVLNAVGCPYAERRSLVSLPLPESLGERSGSLEVPACGCIFCDVAWDKGYFGSLEREKVWSQIRNLPEKEGRKVPFELIDEYPLSSLKGILEAVTRAGLRLSQIDLVCRVDDILSRAELLEEILKTAKEKQIIIRFTSIGFESFSDRILRYFNKGITVADSLRCIGILRRLKDRFGDGLLYRRDEGANHGFIHPTPWDDSETEAENRTNILLYRLMDDILPGHSTPMIIHHGSCLGDWIRRIEYERSVAFKREGTWIEWWSPPISMA